MNDYEQFLASKLVAARPHGFDTMPRADYLFPFQSDLVRWAVRLGRAAIFADTGLGKSRQQLEWARLVAAHTSGDVLILAPLSVAPQTVREGVAIGVHVTPCREAADVRPGVNITNYDRLHLFDASRFAGVVLDESSIIKHHDAKTLARLLEAFGRTPFKLCATATPAPNDFAELGTHAEFLGVCTRTEMLSEYFVHDSGDTQSWRLKGHARRHFWRWVASWGAMVRRPSDLGYEDSQYVLPALEVEHHLIAADHEKAREQGMLFAADAKTLTERRQARRDSMDQRVAECVKQVQLESKEQWVIWCDFNAEQDALAEALGDEAVSIYGALDADKKEKLHSEWLAGNKRVLISKPSIFGHGLNWQHCARAAFVGLSDSYEMFYQAVRRCWRFGQKRSVHVHVFIGESERVVLQNILRKEEDARHMGVELAQETGESVRSSVLGVSTRIATTYNAEQTMALPSWLRRTA